MRSWELAEGEEIVPGRTAVSLLGGGHRYEAYLAWDDALRALVVVKLLRPGKAGDARALRALEHEASLLGGLAHPLLVRMFAHEPAGERPHLVLEHVEGPRLSTLVRSYGVILEQALPLALHLCSALHYMHGRDVVHLDVKPRNIIMAGGARLIDLSVARRLDELATVSSPVGTDAYMAPEQCDPERFGEIGPASDMWGAAVTVVEALSGTLPYPRPHESLPFPQLVRVPRLPEGLPPALAAVLAACLEREPLRRPAPGEMADALEPVVEALPAPKIGNFRPGARELRRRLELA